MSKKMLTVSNEDFRKIADMLFDDLCRGLSGSTTPNDDTIVGVQRLLSEKQTLPTKFSAEQLEASSVSGDIVHVLFVMDELPVGVWAREVVEINSHNDFLGVIATLQECGFRVVNAPRELTSYLQASHDDYALTSNGLWRIQRWCDPHLGVIKRTKTSAAKMADAFGQDTSNQGV